MTTPALRKDQNGRVVSEASETIPDEIDPASPESTMIAMMPA